MDRRRNGTILRTINSGGKLGKGISGVTEDLLGVAFLSERFGFAVGSNGHDPENDTAGAYWERVESGTTSGSRTSNFPMRKTE